LTRFIRHKGPGNNKKNCKVTKGDLITVGKGQKNDSKDNMQQSERD